MDPDCAICHAPASVACDCEAKGLEIAVKQAEARMMQSIYNEIREWVRSQAQDYILEFFRTLTERRKASHAQHLERVTAHAWHYYNAPPHPSEITTASQMLKRGIDEDWQTSVQRYPEVLEYFFSLVELTLPNDDDVAVRDPPLSALNGSRKISRRTPAPTIASGGFGIPDRDAVMRGARTPPPPERLERRTPAPRERRHSYRPPHAPLPTAPPSGYYATHYP